MLRLLEIDERFQMKRKKMKLFSRCSADQVEVENVTFCVRQTSETKRARYPDEDN